MRNNQLRTVTFVFSNLTFNYGALSTLSKMKCYKYHSKCAVSDCSLKCLLEVTQGVGFTLKSVGFTLKSAGLTLQVSTLHV
jgi:hypothetical protein